jgi:hypothetical protein
VIQIEKFAPDHAANDGELLDHHTGGLDKSMGMARESVAPH